MVIGRQSSRTSNFSKEASHDTVNQLAYCDHGSIFNLFRDPPVGRIIMEGNQESYRSETPFAICQELLSCCYRVAVARSHIKQINLVRGSVCLRPSGFQKLPPLPPSRAWLARSLSWLLGGESTQATLLLFYLNSSSK